jgi:glyoxylate/hydroxypyruvate reductase A
MTNRLISIDDIMTAKVFVGPEVDEPIRQALVAAGVNVASDGEPAIAITVRGQELPDSVVWVHSVYMGVDSFLGQLGPSVELVTRTIGQMPARLGRYVETMVMAERWALHQLFRQQAAHQWQVLPVPRAGDSGTAIIVGTGQVGSAIADRLRPSFARLLGVSRSGQATAPFDEVMALTDQVPWEQADCVVVALPATAQTVDAIDSTAINQMTGAHLVSIGRGVTVNLNALQQGLTAGSLRHATVDVLPVEPPSADSWLWNHPQVTITPHIAGLTLPEDVVEAFTSARQAIAQGKQPDYKVDQARGY